MLHTTMHALVVSLIDGYPAANERVEVLMAGELEDIGTRLREERDRVGISQRELARRIGLSASMISQIESGQSKPSVSTLYAIVTELGVSVDDIFRGHEDHAASDASPDTGADGRRGGARPGRASGRPPRDRSRFGRSLGAPDDPSSRGRRLPPRDLRRRRVVGGRQRRDATPRPRVRLHPVRTPRGCSSASNSTSSDRAIRSGSTRRRRIGCGTSARSRCTGSGSWSAAKASDDRSRTVRPFTLTRNEHRD